MVVPSTFISHYQTNDLNSWVSPLPNVPSFNVPVPMFHTPLESTFQDTSTRLEAIPSNDYGHHDEEIQKALSEIADKFDHYDVFLECFQRVLLDYSHGKRFPNGPWPLSLERNFLLIFDYFVYGTQRLPEDLSTHPLAADDNEHIVDSLFNSLHQIEKKRGDRDYYDIKDCLQKYFMLLVLGEPVSPAHEFPDEILDRHSELRSTLGEFHAKFLDASTSMQQSLFEYIGDVLYKIESAQREKKISRSWWRRLRRHLFRNGDDQKKLDEIRYARKILFPILISRSPQDLEIEMSHWLEKTLLERNFKLNNGMLLDGIIPTDPNDDSLN